ncbi:MAG: single-stranded DNA-binding protein [Leptolyngbyaceae cyanobacterium HOT.MB2.61]|jgi:single-strand DNA-binding protein|nr:single-stranded DNA-binding protein [Leptolyngbyaceae cyanobacterium HOT.MB2.61]
MSSVGLNKWIVSGNLAADAEIKTVDLKSGEKAKVAEATMYVRKPRSKDESFTVRLSIWENSAAWRRLPYLKKGSLIICTGTVEPNPFISSSDNKPKAGLRMTVVDIDLDNVRGMEEEGDLVESPPTDMVPKSETASKGETQPAASQSSANSREAKAKGSDTAPQSNGNKAPATAKD